MFPMLKFIETQLEQYKKVEYSLQLGGSHFLRKGGGPKYWDSRSHKFYDPPPIF